MNRTTLTACAAALALTLASCGSDGGTTAGPDRSTTAPTADAAPKRIVSMSPTATETLFAIGAGKQVVAADDYSNYPASAPSTDLSASEPSVEAIAGYRPDLVVLSDDAVAHQLEQLDIDVVVAPAAKDLDAAYRQIRTLGKATGHARKADALADSMADEIDELAAAAATRDEPITFFHELDPTLYTATSSTFIGQLYEKVGLENVADAADAGGTSGGYPQVSSEFLLEADPDLVFLADTKCCEQDATTFAARPGFDQLTAVTTSGVIELDDDIASRWGPRLVDFLEQVVQAVESR